MRIFSSLLILLQACSELYFEVVGYVYLIKVGNFPENEIITVEDHVQNDIFIIKTQIIALDRCCRQF